MRSKPEHNDRLDSDLYRELSLLSAVQSTPETSQRDLARRLGIALGLTNLLLRNLAKKGYVRITRTGWRRWFYALTPAGFSRKVELTVAYIHRFLDHYQRVRQTLMAELEPLRLTAESRVAIYGAGDLAEMGYLVLKDLGIEEIEGFTKEDMMPGQFVGMPVRDGATRRPEQ